VEVDVETGAYKILDYLVVPDSGLIVHPRAFTAQALGGAIQGFGQVLGNKWVFDNQYGVSVAKRFYHTKPVTMLDVPIEMRCEPVGIPEPGQPIGAKGIGEVAKCLGAAALRCALAGALGDDYFRRTPITLDMVLNSVEAGHRVDAGLATNV
jgi:CO/xanthine dehydrogenase Mo-binding subunit